MNDPALWTERAVLVCQAHAHSLVGNDLAEALAWTRIEEIDIFLGGKQ